MIGLEEAPHTKQQSADGIIGLVSPYCYRISSEKELTPLRLMGLLVRRHQASSGTLLIALRCSGRLIKELWILSSKLKLQNECICVLENISTGFLSYYWPERNISIKILTTWTLEQEVWEFRGLSRGHTWYWKIVLKVVDELKESRNKHKLEIYRILLGLIDQVFTFQTPIWF